MPSVSLKLLLIHKPTFNAQLFILQGFYLAWYGICSTSSYLLPEKHLGCLVNVFFIFFSYRNFNLCLRSTKLQEFFPEQVGMEQHREQTHHFKQTSKKGLRDGKWTRGGVRHSMVNSYHSGAQSRSRLSRTWNKFVLSHQCGRAGEKQVLNSKKAMEWKWRFKQLVFKVSVCQLWGRLQKEAFQHQAVKTQPLKGQLPLWVEEIQSYCWEGCCTQVEWFPLSTEAKPTAFH